MEQHKIDRINELARLSRMRALTEAERAEQAALRAEYLALFRASFGAMLERTVIERPDGTREKLKKRGAVSPQGPAGPVPFPEKPRQEKRLFPCPGETQTESAAETEALGAALARQMRADASLPRYIALDGDLGVGKTAFVRGFASVAAPGAVVRSPTFTLVNEYGKEPFKLFHMDMYRVGSEDDLYSVGYEDYLRRNGVCLVEWSVNIPFALPGAYLEVRITKPDPAHPDRRLIRITAVKEGAC